MQQFKENDRNDYYNPTLLRTGLIAALGGILIYFLIVMTGMALTQR